MRSENWNWAIRWLHWLTFWVALGCVLAVWSHEAFDKGSILRTQLMQGHFLLGGLIAVLAVMRLLLRAISSAPAHGISSLNTLLAGLGHGGLYALMFLLPLSGYVGASGKGLPLDLLGLWQLPPAPVGREVAHFAKEVHEALGNIFIGLVGVHVAAAAYHAIILRDKVLQSMLGRA